MKLMTGVGVLMLVLAGQALAAEKDSATFRIQASAEGDFVCLHIPYNLMAESKMATVVREKGYTHLINPQVIASGPNMFICGLVDAKK